MRTRAGQKSKRDWSMLAQRPGWQLWLTTVGRDHRWVNLHLFRDTAGPGKASFWLGWSHKDRRFARNYDHAALAIFYVDVAKWVQEELLEYSKLAEEMAAEELV